MHTWLTNRKQSITNLTDAEYYRILHSNIFIIFFSVYLLRFVSYHFHSALAVVSKKL